MVMNHRILELEELLD